jgi:hypothetical protein
MLEWWVDRSRPESRVEPSIGLQLQRQKEPTERNGAIVSHRFVLLSLPPDSRHSKTDETRRKEECNKSQKDIDNPGKGAKRFFREENY